MSFSVILNQAQIDPTTAQSFSCQEREDYRIIRVRTKRQASWGGFGLSVFLPWWGALHPPHYITLLTVHSLSGEMELTTQTKLPQSFHDSTTNNGVNSRMIPRTMLNTSSLSLPFFLEMPSEFPSHTQFRSYNSPLQTTSFPLSSE